MNEKVTKFYEVVSADDALQAELEAVAGGAKCGCVIVGAVKGCGCVIFGGAKKDDSGKGPTLCLMGVGV